jgi:hypothetical protein
LRPLSGTIDPQPSDTIAARQNIFGNVGTLHSFRVGHRDVDWLEHEFARKLAAFVCLPESIRVWVEAMLTEERGLHLAKPAARR